MQFEEMTCQNSFQDLIEFHNKESEYVVLDLETTGLSYHSDKILNVVISGTTPGHVVYVDNSFISLLSNLRTGLVIHNAKFDLHMLYRSGVDFRTRVVRDTMLMHHLYDENARHGLDSIVQDWYGDKYKEEFWAKNRTFEEASKEDRTTYMCKDVYYTQKIYGELTHGLASQGIPNGLVEHVHTLAKSLLNTEIEGIRVDEDYLNTLAIQLGLKINDLDKQMRTLVKAECENVEFDAWIKEIEKRSSVLGRRRVPKPIFNFDSIKQLERLIHCQLKIPPVKNGRGKTSLDDSCLEKIRHKHPFIPILQDYRQYRKVFTAFVEGTKEKQVGNRIYPSFNINGTVTGRISSSGPNLQQLPREGGVRGLYLPDPGYSFISCDYSQLEVTIAAHFSGDKSLLRIINEGVSQHDITAEGMGIPRQQAKTINFAMQYGAGPHKIAQILGCSFEKAEKAINKYWETYAGLKKSVDQCHRQVEEGQPIVSPFGRKRRFPEGLRAKELERAKRQAFSSLVQGTGADLTSLAFYLIDQRLRKDEIGKGLFTVHDEILVAAKQGHEDKVREVVTTYMVGVGTRSGIDGHGVELAVPLRVDCSKPMSRWED